MGGGGGAIIVFIFAPNNLQIESVDNSLSGSEHFFLLGS